MNPCQRFLARDSIYAIARYMPSPVRLSVRPSVRLSVTRVDQSCLGGNNGLTNEDRPALSARELLRTESTFQRCTSR